MITGAKNSVDEFQQKAGKFMLIYTILTLVCLVLDIFVIFIGIGGMNSDVGAFGTVFILLLGILYFMVGFFFIGWVIAVRMRLPEYARVQVMMGLLGLFKKLTMAIDDKFYEVTGKERPPAPVAADKASAGPSSSSNNAAAGPAAGAGGAAGAKAPPSNQGNPKGRPASNKA